MHIASVVTRIHNRTPRLYITMFSFFGGTNKENVNDNKVEENYCEDDCNPHTVPTVDAFEEGGSGSIVDTPGDECFQHSDCTDFLEEDALLKKEKQNGASCYSEESGESPKEANNHEIQLVQHTPDQPIRNDSTIQDEDTDCDGDDDGRLTREDFDRITNQRDEIIHLQKLQIRDQRNLHHSILKHIELQSAVYKQNLITENGMPSHLSKTNNANPKLQQEDQEPPPDSVIHGDMIEIQNLLKQMNVENENWRKRFDVFARNMYAVQVQQNKDIQCLHKLMIDSIRELRQINLESGENLTHQKARLQSYKVRGYDSFKE